MSQASRSAKHRLIAGTCVALATGLSAVLVGCPQPMGPLDRLISYAPFCFTYFHDKRDSPNVNDLRYLGRADFTNDGGERVHWQLDKPLPFGYDIDPRYGVAAAGERVRPLVFAYRELGDTDPDPFFLSIRFSDSPNAQKTSLEEGVTGDVLQIPIEAKILSVDVLDDFSDIRQLVYSLGMNGDNEEEQKADSGGHHGGHFGRKSPVNLVYPAVIEKLKQLSFISTPRFPAGNVEIAGVGVDCRPILNLAEIFQFIQTTKGAEAPAFPCGDGPNGFTVCPEFDAGLPVDENFILVTSVVMEDIPIDDPSNTYQYGFVFETDGDPDNDFVPGAAFPNDTFKGTDTWYFLTYNPTDDWSLTAAHVQNDNSVQEVFTSARGIIRGNTVSVAIPESELMDAAKISPLINARFRTTAFEGPVTTDVLNDPVFAAQASLDLSTDNNDDLEVFVPLRLQLQF